MAKNTSQTAPGNQRVVGRILSQVGRKTRTKRKNIKINTRVCVCVFFCCDQKTPTNLTARTGNNAFGVSDGGNPQWEDEKRTVDFVLLT